LQYGKDNIQPGFHMPNENYEMMGHKDHFMHLCKENVGRHCEVEMEDGNVYSGMIHSYDNNNMYLIMQMQNRGSDSERFFPGFGFGFPFFVSPFFPGFGLFGFPFRHFRRFRRFW
jgi:hypothetical protein